MGELSLRRMGAKDGMCIKKAITLSSAPDLPYTFSCPFTPDLLQLRMQTQNGTYANALRSLIVSSDFYDYTYYDSYEYRETGTPTISGNAWTIGRLVITFNGTTATISASAANSNGIQRLNAGTWPLMAMKAE